MFEIMSGICDDRTLWSEIILGSEIGSLKQELALKCSSQEGEESGDGPGIVYDPVKKQLPGGAYVKLAIKRSIITPWPDIGSSLGYKVHISVLMAI